LTTTTKTRLTRKPRKAMMTRTYLPREEKEALLCIDPHHTDEADKEAQEGDDDKDLLVPARGGEGGAGVS